MTGITILNTIEVIGTEHIALLSIIGGFIGCVLFGVLFIAFSDDGKIFFAWLNGIFWLISVCCMIAGLFSSPNFHHYEYEVLIDEEVNLIDFYEKYDIIEKKGEIYVIKERGDDRDE